MNPEGTSTQRKEMAMGKACERSVCAMCVYVCVCACVCVARREKEAAMAKDNGRCHEAVYIRSGIDLYIH